jgi:hypothetical protein
MAGTNLPPAEPVTLRMGGPLRRPFHTYLNDKSAGPMNKSNLFDVRQIMGFGGGTT